MDVGDVDVDMDIDLGPLDAGEDDMQLSLDQSSFLPHLNEANGAASTHIANPKSEETAANKVYIRGLDDLTTNEIRAFSVEHNPEFPVTRIEWINDSSANLVYDTPAVALDALSNFTSQVTELPPNLSLHDLRLAKPVASHPGSHLEVRIALVTDRKRPHAYETSRFYLMHPEYDPREQRKRNGGRGNSRQAYRKRRYSNIEDQRRRRKDVDYGFDASMYDDNGPSTTRESAVSSPIGRSRREVDSYRPVRDRSASPDIQDDRRLRRRRTPSPVNRSRDPNFLPKQNRDKELFPRKNTQSEGHELFSNKLLASKVKKDLFLHKTKTSNHRRSSAFDAADETADLFAGRLSVPFTDGASSGTSLADGITKVPQTSYGRLNNFVDDGGEVPIRKGAGNNGLNIRGASQGFSIRGVASDAHVGTIKELFPGKANAGKELFSEKLKGRGGPRTKAEDLFY
ncbi:MAG: hypothetical protein Q9217_005317 [Psora testacea]